MSESTIRRFIFEHLDIRGAVVHLGDSWQQCRLTATTSRLSPNCLANWRLSRR